MSFSGDCNEDCYKNPYDINININIKVILTAITSLLIVVVIVVALQVYARCFLRRRERSRRAAFHRLGLTLNQAHDPPKGLDPTVIASLPIFVVKRTDGQDRTVDCAVCMSSLEDQEMARLLPNCGHTFHAECIDKWLASHSTCPICRTEAEPRMMQPEHREGPAGKAASAPGLDRASESDGGATLSGSSLPLNSF